MQTIFMIIPADTLRLYNMMLRPLVYATLAVIVYVFMGLDSRPVRKAHSANMIAVLSVALFGFVFFITIFLFGAGANVMTMNASVVMRNIWERGTIVVLGELIRYKLIKGADPQNRAGTVIMLTIVLAYGHMDGIRMLLDGNVIVWAIFYESIFRYLVISAAASFFAIQGSFLSVLLISFVYIMVTYLVPIMPDISPIAWSLIISCVVFASAITYHFIISEKGRTQRKREKQTAKYYAKRPILFNAATAAAVVAIVAFFMGMFPVYPLVVLTGSMAGTIERGSLVFIERVPPGEAYIMVGEGEVIHFISHGRVEYIHRVVDFVHDTYGERQYITRGDANHVTDPFPVPPDDVLGIARATMPALGYPYIYLRAILRVLN